MQSKRDQVQAHMFVMGRLNSGMLLAEPDAPESPLSRTTRGLVYGLVITVLIGAGSFLYGVISPGGNDTWRAEGTLVVNRDTGSRYLYLDGRLRPVDTYASALLLAGADLTTVDVGTASLSDTPLGAPLGIPGAPDQVPAADALAGGAWQVCSVPVTGAGADAAAATVLAVGAVADGSDPLGADEGLLLAGPDGTLHLMWHGSRLRLDPDSGAPEALGYGTATPRPVSRAFLDALAAGPDLAAPEVPGRGTDGPDLGGAPTRVGQVFEVQVPGGDAGWYLLGEDGLTPLTDTTAALVLGDPRTRTTAYEGQAPAVRTLGSDVLKEHLAPAGALDSGAAAAVPAAPPRLVPVPEGGAACTALEPGPDGTRLSGVLVAAEALTPLVAPGDPDREAACLPVDGVVVPPAGGDLVRALGAGGGALGDTTYLVTEEGTKYRVSDDEALAALGYTASDMAALPSTLLSMLPTGPDLGTEAASTGTARVTAPDCG
ncbi:type VII secretion protein EccB [Streptomyces sp. NPDC056716]|uniref:type VII secretion protein EccB n=1 Tax=unclassified Streptomyces TaxID=2593676 RepID=UPI0036806236